MHWVSSTIAVTAFFFHLRTKGDVSFLARENYSLIVLAIVAPATTMHALQLRIAQRERAGNRGKQWRGLPMPEQCPETAASSSANDTTLALHLANYETAGRVTDSQKSKAEQRRGNIGNILLRDNETIYRQLVGGPVQIFLGGSYSSVFT